MLKILLMISSALRDMQEVLIIAAFVSLSKLLLYLHVLNVTECALSSWP